jgi:hypothetical protein
MARLQKTSQKTPTLKQGMNGLLHTSNKCAILSATAVFFWMLPSSTGLRTILLSSSNGFGRGTSVV